MNNKDSAQVVVEGLYFSYGKNIILQDVSFLIKRGDFLAILGPNGSGKTTLIKIILSILPFSNGMIKLFSQPLKEFSEWSRLGYVPQKATHFDNLFPASVKEVVSMGLLSKKRFPRLFSGRDIQAIEKALEDVDMKEFKDRKIGELSGGQQQRIFIARAIVNQPEILFLDEPTTGVDAATQNHFYDMLNGLNKQNGMTIVLITHDIGVVSRYVTKVACLNQRLIFHGTHEEFCQSAVVLEFLEGKQHLISHMH